MKKLLLILTCVAALGCQLNNNPVGQSPITDSTEFSTTNPDKQPSVILYNNVDSLNKFAKDNQYLITMGMGYIFNEYANEDLIASYTPYNNGHASNERGFIIVRNGKVHTTSFNIPDVCTNRTSCIWNGNYVTVSVGDSYYDESTGLYGFQINNEDLSQPAKLLWSNTDIQLRWVSIFAFSEKVGNNYYCAGERNFQYRSSFRCNMTTGEVLFTDDEQVNRTFMPIVYTDGAYYGCCSIGKYCVAKATQYYDNKTTNTQQIGLLNMDGLYTYNRSFDFSNKRGVITTLVGQLYYPVFLSTGEIDESTPGLSNIYAYKYKDKCYTLRGYTTHSQLEKTDDIAYLFDDKYITINESFK